MSENIKDSLTTGETWIRGLYLLLFLIIYSIVEIVAFAIVVLQFIFLLFTREPNDRLLEFGDDVTVYIYQIWQFLTLNSDERPFPFAPWPYAGEGPDYADIDVGPVADAETTPSGPDLTDDEDTVLEREPEAGVRDDDARQPRDEDDARQPGDEDDEDKR